MLTLGSVLTVLLFPVVDGASEHLLHRLGRGLAGVLQHVQRLVDVQTADAVHHKTGLARGPGVVVRPGVVDEFRYSFHASFH